MKKHKYTKKLLRFFRDPAWGAFAVIITILGGFFSYDSLSNAIGDKKELSILYLGSEYFDSPLFPKDKFKLLIEGNKLREKSADVNIDYFLIVNSSNKAIIKNDFISPISLLKGKKGGEIVSVESCEKSIAEACSSDNTSTQDLNYTPMSWTKKKGKWNSVPNLMNSNESGCVAVMSKKTIDSKKIPILEKFTWDVRIKDIHKKIYSSYETFYYENQTKQDYLLSIALVIQGAGLYWFFILFISFFSITYYLAQKSNWLTKSGSFINTIKVSTFAILSISFASVLVDLYINKREFSDIFPLGWVLIALYIIISFYVAYKAHDNYKLKA